METARKNDVYYYMDPVIPHDDHMANPLKIESELSRILTDFAEVKLAILYGSAARRTMHPGSDVDLAVAAHPRRELDPELLIDISLACGDAVADRDLLDAEWSPSASVTFATMPSASFTRGSINRRGARRDRG